MWVDTFVTKNERQQQRLLVLINIGDESVNVICSEYFRVTHIHTHSRSRVRIRSPRFGIEWNVYTFLCERNLVITIMLTLTCVHFRHLASSRQSTTFYITHWMMVAAAVRGGTEVHTMSVSLCVLFTCAIYAFYENFEKMSPGICKKNSNWTVPAALKKKKKLIERNGEWKRKRVL